MEKVLQARDKQKENTKQKIQAKQKEESFVSTPSLTGKELEEFLLKKNDLDDF